MPSPISALPLAALIERQLPSVTVRSIDAMPGGMSSRRFFRATLTPAPGRSSSAPSGSDSSATAPAPTSVVGVFTPDALKSDEASHQSSVAPKEWPFLEVHGLLAQAGVRVPRVFGVDYDTGWMVVEDLGDLTLAQALLENPDHKTHLYQVAVADLARAHGALASLPATCIVRQRRFDYPLLHWEIEHFREFALLAQNIVPNPDQARRFSELADALAHYVAQLPTGFVHRDYQSRNLMWLPTPSSSSSASPSGELVWIDFQDALTGPRIYDLVALLNDSYQTFTRDFVEARLRQYAEARNDPTLSGERAIFEFDVVTVQRKLKDAGRFVYFYVKNGDASYLPFVEPTVAKIKASLRRLPPEPLFVGFRELLEELLPGV